MRQKQSPAIRATRTDSTDWIHYICPLHLTHDTRHCAFQPQVWAAARESFVVLCATQALQARQFRSRVVTGFWRLAYAGQFSTNSDQHLRTAGRSRHGPPLAAQTDSHARSQCYLATRSKGTNSRQLDATIRHPLLTAAPASSGLMSRQHSHVAPLVGLETHSSRRYPPPHRPWS